MHVLDKLDLGMRPVGAAEIATFPVRIDRAHDLHVLLRHRLLLQPHGFEGLIAVEEDADATDLAFNEVVDVRAFGTGCAVGLGRGGSFLAPIAAGYLFQAGYGLPTVAVFMGLGSTMAAIVLLLLKIGDLY